MKTKTIVTLVILNLIAIAAFSQMDTVSKKRMSPTDIIDYGNNNMQYIPKQDTMRHRLKKNKHATDSTKENKEDTVNRLERKPYMYMPPPEKDSAR
jgi:hypothetical protein